MKMSLIIDNIIISISWIKGRKKKIDGKYFVDYWEFWGKCLSKDANDILRISMKRKNVYKMSDKEIEVKIAWNINQITNDKGVEITEYYGKMIPTDKHLPYDVAYV